MLPAAYRFSCVLFYPQSQNAVLEGWNLLATPGKYNTNTLLWEGAISEICSSFDNDIVTQRDALMLTAAAFPIHMEALSQKIWKPTVYCTEPTQTAPRQQPSLAQSTGTELRLSNGKLDLPFTGAARTVDQHECVSCLFFSAVLKYIFFNCKINFKNMILIHTPKIKIHNLKNISPFHQLLFNGVSLHSWTPNSKFLSAQNVIKLYSHQCWHAEQQQGENVREKNKKREQNITKAGCWRREHNYWIMKTGWMH